MPSKRTNNFPESGRGLGHMTPTIFGSTVGYPSDSLASCLLILLLQTLENFKSFLHAYYTFLSTLDYKFLFNYLQI